LESAYKLLRSEVNPLNGPVQSDERISFGQKLRGNLARLIYTPNAKGTLERLPNDSVVDVKLAALVDTSSTIYYIAEISMPDGSLWHDETLPKSVTLEGRNAFTTTVTLFKSAGLHLHPDISGPDLEKLLTGIFGESAHFDHSADSKTQKILVVD